MEIILRSLAITIFFSASSCSAESLNKGSPNGAADVAIGEEIRFCEGCPVFVRVPDAPESLRPIRFVSKYELTWKNYLAAYDDDACGFAEKAGNKIVEQNGNRQAASADKAPPARALSRKSNTLDDKSRKEKMLEQAGNLRIEWPIVELSPVDIECYTSWLQRKTDLQVSVPTEKEWEWFAAAGQTSRKYPWGNNPDVSKEALNRNKVLPELDRPKFLKSRRGLKFSPFIPGVKVGSFSPNPWGIHDLMGNVSEFTQDMLESGKAKDNIKIDSSYDRVIIKGGSYNDNWWEANGITGRQITTIYHNRYGYRAGHRLVLLAEDDFQ